MLRLRVPRCFKDGTILLRVVVVAALFLPMSDHKNVADSLRSRAEPRAGTADDRPDIPSLVTGSRRTNAGIVRYKYDDLNRLVSAIYGGGR